MKREVVVVARLRAAPGKGDALAALLAEQVAAVLASEPGCTAYRLLRSDVDPDDFCFYETYVDDAAFELHRHSPRLAAFRERRQREGLVAGPAEVVVCRVVAG
ncbi:MAG: putative quinol monooxygenase [Burkholderiales bacterium]